MTKNTFAVVVVATGLVINLRFLLYSAGMAPYLRESRLLTKLGTAHFLTDQSYAIMVDNHKKIETSLQGVNFYFGTVACMFLVWHSSWIAGYIFGNFAPATWSLDFAVPLSFLAILVPSLKTKKHVAIALLSTFLSVVLFTMPLKLGLLMTALICISIAYAMIAREETP